MTRDDGFFGVLEGYLDAKDGPAALPVGVRDAVRARIRLTSQRRGLLPAIGSSGWLRLAGLGVPAMAATVIALALLASNLAAPGGPAFPPSGDPAGTSRPTPTAVEPLGVFWPVQGRIVFRVGSHLEGIDPEDPGSGAVIEPGNLGLGTGLMPVGWAADGTRLAIEDGPRGDRYLMDDSGTLRRIDDDLPVPLRGESDVVRANWLSPDGSEGLAFTAEQPGRLYIVDLDEVEHSRLIDTAAGEPFGKGDGEPWSPTWSPDGTQVAFVVTMAAGDAASIAVLDLATGRSHLLGASWPLVRHLAWSPDGSQIAVVAGPEPARIPNFNQLFESNEASIYLVDVASGEARELSAAHFIAVAWSPDGGRIAAIDYAVRRRSVVVLEVAGDGRPRELVVLSTTVSGNQTYLLSGITWHPRAAP